MVSNPLTATRRTFAMDIIRSVAQIIAGVIAGICLLTQPALAQDATEAPGFWELLFDKGGIVTWMIALLSAVGLPIATVKIYQFYHMDIWRPKSVIAALEHYRKGQVKGLSAHFSALTHPAAALFSYAIAEAHSKTLPAHLLREETTRRAQYLLRSLSGNIWVLELIAVSAPLFGLLGTVLGMIVAFQSIGQGGSGADTAMLAAGIWEALLTTAFGLGVALPFSMIVAVLHNGVDEVRDLIEDALSDILVRSETPS